MLLLAALCATVHSKKTVMLALQVGVMPMLCFVAGRVLRMNDLHSFCLLLMGKRAHIYRAIASLDALLLA